MNRTVWMTTLAAAMAASAHAAPLASGKYLVDSVIEGDLITVDAAGKKVEVRLYGADAPETGQQFREEARAFVESALLGKEVALDAVTQEEESGRPVAVVRVPEGGVLHELLVSEGLAWWDSVNVPENATLKRLNAQAIGGEKGLWKDATALAPWDYRKSNELPTVTYLKEETPDPELAKAEPKVLKLQGNAAPEQAPEYGGNMPAETAPTGLAEPVRAGSITAPGGLPDMGDVDVFGMAMKHNLRVQTDSSGNALGFTADNIAQIPGASALGFQEGDVVTGVNGNPVTDMGQAMALADKLKNEKSLNISILRNGQNTSLNIPIR